MNTMSYNGYIAKIAYSEEDHCFIGHIAGINDVIGFHGESVEELETAFREAVDDYLETCKKLGRSPQKTYSGHIMLRLSPEIHAKAAVMAEANGKSLNSFMIEMLVKDLNNASTQARKHPRKRTVKMKTLRNPDVMQVKRSKMER